MEPCAVMTITETLILSLRSARSASIPPILGISRSSNTRSGTSFRIALRACSPLPAVATSHSSGRSLTSKRRRDAGSSSTISTRAPLVCMIVSHRCSTKRIHHRDTGSLCGFQSFQRFQPFKPLKISGIDSSSAPLFLSSIFDLRLLPQPRGYFLNEYVFIDGLRDVADTTGSQCFLSIPLHRVGGNRDYRNIGRGGLCLYSSGDFKPVHSRKLNIHHNQIGAFVLNILKSFLRRRRLMHFVPLRPKQKHR